MTDVLGAGFRVGRVLELVRCRTPCLSRFVILDPG